MPPALPAVAVPDKYQSDKFVQLLLATIEFQTERAERAEDENKTFIGQIRQLQSDRNEWKNLYLSEREATKNLQTALAEERTASARFREGLQIAQNQRDLDKGRISDLEAENKSLRRSRWKYAAVGFVAGFAVGVPSGVAVSYRFNF